MFGWVSADLRLIHGEHAALGKDGANLTEVRSCVFSISRRHILVGITERDIFSGFTGHWDMFQVRYWTVLPGHLENFHS